MLKLYRLLAVCMKVVNVQGIIGNCGRTNCNFRLFEGSLECICQFSSYDIVVGKCKPILCITVSLEGSAGRKSTI